MLPPLEDPLPLLEEGKLPPFVLDEHACMLLPTERVAQRPTERAKMGRMF